MQNDGRYALATMAGAIVLAAATIIVGFHAGTVLERIELPVVGHPSSPAAAPGNRAVIPDPHLADRT